MPAGASVGPEEEGEALEDLRLVEVGVRCSLEQMLEEVGAGWRQGLGLDTCGGLTLAPRAALGRHQTTMSLLLTPPPQGFYHADPHPGNLLKTPDGRLAYLDFGEGGGGKGDGGHKWEAGGHST